MLSEPKECNENKHSQQIKSDIQSASTRWAPSRSRLVYGWRKTHVNASKNKTNWKWFFCLLIGKQLQHLILWYYKFLSLIDKPLQLLDFYLKKINFGFWNVVVIFLSGRWWQREWEWIEATLLVGVLSVFIISRNFLIRIVNSLMATLTIIYVYYV